MALGVGSLLPASFASATTAMGSALSSFLGLRSIPKLYYAAKPARLRLKTSDNSADAEEVPLDDLVEKRCPSLHNVFAQAWWLPESVPSLSSSCHAADPSTMPVETFRRHTVSSVTSPRWTRSNTTGESCCSTPTTSPVACQGF